jgi:hypothetical protein
MPFLLVVRADQIGLNQGEVVGDLRRLDADRPERSRFVNMSRLEPPVKIEVKVAARDPRLPFALGRLLFIYIDANAPRQSSVHLQWTVGWIGCVDVRTIPALLIPFETAEPTANFFVRGAISESQRLSSLTNMPMALSSPARPHKNLIIGTGPHDHRDLQRA